MAGTPMDVDDKLAIPDERLIQIWSDFPDKRIWDKNGNLTEWAYTLPCLTGLLADIIQRFNLPSRTLEEITSLLEKNSSFARQLAGLWKKGQGFKEIYSHPLLQPPRPSPKDIQKHAGSTAATEESWKRDFKGDSASTLIKTIRSYLGRQTIYAPCSVIVNSSGTGKSRMVDEMGKTVIVVPMCLRSGIDGFPPPDVELRKWLTASLKTQQEAEDKAHAFLFGLLKTTHNALEKMVKQGCQGLPMLASTFRTKMTDGQTFKGHNDYREDFYNRVVKLATELPAPSNLKSSPNSKSSDSTPLQSISSTLVKLLHKHDPKPLVVLAFDESHELTANPSGWSMYTSIRRALRSLGSSPVFGLFLSTAGKFLAFSQPTYLEISARLVDGTLHLLPPITETGFDQLAYRSKEGELTLDHVTGLKFMSHLGRPLFGSRWDAGNAVIREDIVAFAKAKLLNTFSENTPEDQQTLACLAVRLALEFRPTTQQHRECEMKQIERHMRICIGAEPGFERMLSVAASEPLLAEAAVNISLQNPAKELACHLDIWGVDRGDRGELAAMLLLLQARDNACSKSHHRHLTVQEFMEALLPEAFHKDLSNFRGVNSSPGSSPCFAERFKSSRIWFNHFIKAYDRGILSTKYLWRIAVRGAAILCANNQQGVDLVIPVLYQGETLQQRNMTAILIQVKNDGSFGNSVVEYLFEGMNPHTLKLFPDIQSQHPVIRMVFALASDKSTVKFFSPERQSDRLKTKTTATGGVYDIWMAGLSSDVFSVIENDNLTYYKTLISPIPHINIVYGLAKENAEVQTARGTLRKQANPATETEDVFYNMYLDI